MHIHIDAFSFLLSKVTFLYQIRKSSQVFFSFLPFCFHSSSVLCQKMKVMVFLSTCMFFFRNFFFVFCTLHQPTSYSIKGNVCLMLYLRTTREKKKTTHILINPFNLFKKRPYHSALSLSLLFNS